jgi:hypothetical protein
LLAGLRQCVFDQRRNDLRLHTYAVRRLLFCRRRLRRRRPVREPLHLVAAHPRRRQSVTTSNSGREAVSTDDASSYAYGVLTVPPSLTATVRYFPVV